MGRHDRPSEVQDRSDEVNALWSAPTADALHRVLVLEPAYGRSADSLEPFALLRRHHEAEPETSVATAVLLLTDRRWRNGLGRLVRRIAGSSILGEEELDLLASTFLAADDAVYWGVPDDWFGAEEFVITLGDPDPDADLDDAPPPAAAGPTVAKRLVAPPLRRWAAEFVVTRDPGSWTAVFARARELDPRSAAAVMAGLLDAIESLVPPAQALVLEAATTWPNQAVRLSALELVARRDGVEVARRLAEHDASARVRSLSGSTLRRDDETAVGPAARAEPPTLF